MDHEGLFEDDLFTHVIGTQEILLFYISSLLRTLAFDSAKVLLKPFLSIIISCRNQLYYQINEENDVYK